MWFVERPSGLPLVMGFTSLAELLAEDMSANAFG
jgi:hypothetical protein